MPVTGWKLEPDERARLLERFAPQWPDVIADHVTLDADARSDAPLPACVSAQIVGGVDDGEGLQAMVVAVEGETERPDGGVFHITWSLDRRRGRRPVQSNDVIAERGWSPIDEPVAIRLVPARF